MDRDGVQTSVIHRMPNDLLAKIVQAYPTRFFGLATLSPFDGMRGVRELERLVREEKVQGMRVGALYNGLAASDRRYYPLYAKCVELDIPVRIYTSMNYANDRPYDLGHPRHLDQVAIDFPELRIIAGLAAGRGSTTWSVCCAGTRTSLATPPRTIRATSAPRARAGRCCCSSATRCCRTR